MAARSDPTMVLLVEDTDEHATLVQQALAEADAPGGFRVFRAARLAEAVARLDEARVDVAMVDLMLPDSRGLDTYRTLQARAPDLPIVVASALGDRAVALTAVREGAQDYLVKDGTLIDVVARALQYAVERKRVQTELARAEAARASAEAELRQARLADQQRRERHERELSSLERLSGGGATTVTARVFGVARLAEAVPERFDQFVRRYGEMIELSLDQRTYKVEHRLSDGLRALADEIGFLHGGPRDVVELHTIALRNRIAEATPRRAQALIDEARVMVLELMGYLVGYYRE